MNERHRKMIDLMEGIKEQARQRDELMTRLEGAIGQEIQRDLDQERGITDETKREHNTLNMDKYNALVDAYERAIDRSDDEFEFQGRVLWTGYARSMIDRTLPAFRGHPVAKKRRR